MGAAVAGLDGVERVCFLADPSSPYFLTFPAGTNVSFFTAGTPASFFPTYLAFSGKSAYFFMGFCSAGTVVMGACVSEDFFILGDLVGEVCSLGFFCCYCAATFVGILVLVIKSLFYFNWDDEL